MAMIVALYSYADVIDKLWNYSEIVFLTFIDSNVGRAGFLPFGNKGFQSKILIIGEGRDEIREAHQPFNFLDSKQAHVASIYRPLARAICAQSDTSPSTGRLGNEVGIMKLLVGNESLVMSSIIFCET